MGELEAVKSESLKFSREFNLDSDAVERVLLGTLTRVKHAASKGEELNEDLVEAAVRHYFDTQEKFYEDLLKNKNGEMDSLNAEVYQAIKSNT